MAHSRTVELIRIGIAARLLGRSPRTLIDWGARGKLRVFRDERGRRYFDIREVRRLAPRPEPHGEHRNEGKVG